MRQPLAGYSGFGGHVYVSGEDFEELERNYSSFKVQRRPVGGDLWFEADMGIAELHLNPCSSPGCGFPKNRHGSGGRHDEISML